MRKLALYLFLGMTICLAGQKGWAEDIPILVSYDTDWVSTGWETPYVHPFYRCLDMTTLLADGSSICRGVAGNGHDAGLGVFEGSHEAEQWTPTPSNPCKDVDITKLIGTYREDSQYTYSPADDGEVASIDAEFWLQHRGGTPGGSFSARVAILQGGDEYVSGQVMQVDSPNGQTGDWVHFGPYTFPADPTTTEEKFGKLNGSDIANVQWNTNPDFSPTGSTMEFGFLLDMAWEGELCYATLLRRLAVDQYSITVNALNTDTDDVPDSLDNCTEVDNDDQIDTNSDDFGNMCDADYYLDNCGVGIGEYGMLSAAWGCEPGDACYNPDIDMDSDGGIGISEFGLLSQQWGGPPGPSGIAECP